MNQTKIHESSKIPIMQHTSPNKQSLGLKMRGYLVIIGCILMMFCAGVTYSFGNLTPYFASILAYQELSHSNMLTSYCDSKVSDCYLKYIYYCNIFFAVSVSCEAILLPLGGKIEMLFNSRLVCFVGGSIISIGYFLSYFILILSSNNTINGITTIILLCISFSVLSAIGGGITYVPPIIIGTKWFPNNQALVTSIITLGWTVAPFLYNYAQTLYINPTNIKITIAYDNNNNNNTKYECGFVLNKSIIINTQNAFIFLGVIILSIAIIGSFAIKDKPETQIDTIINYGAISENEAFKSIQFWQLVLGATTNMICYIFVNSEWKVFGQEYYEIINDHLLTSIGSISMFISAFIQIGLGIIMDYNKSYKIIMSSMMIICCVFFITLIFLKYIIINYLNYDITIGMLYGIWLCVLHSCLIGTYTILPMTIDLTFGTKYSGVILGFIYFGDIIASVIQAILFYIFQSNWIALCISFSICCLIGLFSSINYTYNIKFISYKK